MLGVVGQQCCVRLRAALDWKKKLSLGRLLILHVLVVNKPSPPARICNRVQNQGDVFHAVSNFSLVKIPLVSVTKCVHRSSY